MNSTARLSPMDYVTRVSNATPMELVIITYDIAFDAIDDAMNSETETDFKEYVSKASKAVLQLVLGLDMKYEISADLLSIYLNVNRLLIESTVRINREKLSKAKEVLTSLYEGFIEVKRSEKSDVNMKNAKVFAGLTYDKKGQLSEYYDDTNGFEIQG